MLLQVNSVGYGEAVSSDDKQDFLRSRLNKETSDQPEVVENENIPSRASLNLKARIEENRRYELEDAIETHIRIVELLASASKSLAEASMLSEGLQRKLQTNRYFREINLDRRFRMNEVVRIVNVARHQVSKAHKSSLITNKDVQNSVDDLVRSDFRTSFE